jgi:hypothetical protein
MSDSKNVCQSILVEYILNYKVNGSCSKTALNAQDKVGKFLQWLSHQHPTSAHLQDITTSIIREYVSFLQTPNTQRWGTEHNQRSGIQYQ